ncbi:MAG: hypothetical protein IRZ07_04240 [Microbispora sp.]|nr:hypothetical protein [Microbispora sp.]
MANVIPVDRIDAEARKLDPARVLLTVLAVIPFVLGWLLGKAWLVVAWLWTAAVVGWREACKPRAVDAEGDGT